MKKLFLPFTLLILLSSCTIESSVWEEAEGGWIEEVAWIVEDLRWGDCLVGQWSYVSGMEQMQTVMDEITGISEEDRIKMNFGWTVWEWLFDIENAWENQYKGLYSFNDFGYSVSILNPVIGSIELQTNVVGIQPFFMTVDPTDRTSLTIEPGVNNLTVTTINSLIDEVVTASDLPQWFLWVGDIYCDNTSLDIHHTIPRWDSPLEYDLSFERVR